MSIATILSFQTRVAVRTLFVHLRLTADVFAVVLFAQAARSCNSEISISLFSRSANTFLAFVCSPVRRTAQIAELGVSSDAARIDDEHVVLCNEQDADTAVEVTVVVEEAFPSVRERSDPNIH